MRDSSLILKRIETELKSLPDCENLPDFVREFYQFGNSLGRLVQQELMPSKIEEIEAKYSGGRKKKTKRYYTPRREMIIKRRAYGTPHGMEFKVDKELGLPHHKWLSPVLELACALGVSSEFPNAHKLWKQWTQIEITEKTLANQVEKTGNQLQKQEFYQDAKVKETREDAPKSSSLSKAEEIYVGVDGVMTPLNQKQGYKEARVGVIFGRKDHQKTQKRGVVRHREYIATLKTRNEFRGKVKELYQQIIGEKTPQTIVIGDGAHWIWEMAETQFPGSIEILDFYHLSEYVWKVAKAAYLSSEEKQERWVNSQQQLLKKSQWKTVINSCQKINRKNKELNLAITNLERYLTNNKSRIDYHSYLKLGLMIGSGVVESSNRRVVTQRLKQAGMHWSDQGAEGVMSLRAAYLSSSHKWSSFWRNKEIEEGRRQEAEGRRIDCRGILTRLPPAFFNTKNGQASCHKYIGQAGSPAFLKAVEMMKRRTKIEALQQVEHTLDLGLMDLVEETSRTQKNKNKEKGKSS